MSLAAGCSFSPLKRPGCCCRVYFIILDALPMAFAMATFVVLHPAYCLSNYARLSIGKSQVELSDLKTSDVK